MDRRPLGNTGEELSIVGFGGILVMNAEPSDASRIVAEAVDRGVNYFDVAPSYGNAEERLGPLTLRFPPSGPAQPAVGKIIRVTVHVDEL